MIDEPTDSSYPTLEGLVEGLAEDQVEAVFEALRQQLASLKGPRQTQAKRVEKALDQCQALVVHLLAVRKKLEEDQSPQK